MRGEQHCHSVSPARLEHLLAYTISVRVRPGEMVLTRSLGAGGGGVREHCEGRVIARRRRRRR